MIEGEIWNHPSHPGHKLEMVDMKRPFKCDGCLELGLGSCYTCTDSSSACNFHLHKDCAHAQTEGTTSHPFFPKLQFHFHEKGGPDRYCDACGRDIHGYVYHCHEEKPYDYDLHPCCAKLPRCRDVVSEDGEEVIRLVLKKEVSSKCCKCGEKKLLVSWRKKKINTWSYVSENKGVHFHVACVKEMVCESWQQDPDGLQIERRDAAAAAACPKLQVKLYKESKWRGKFGMLKKVLKLALTFAIAAVIGDPTAMVVALVTSLITR